MSTSTIRWQTTGLPLVSILMAAYNHERWIEEAIRSVWGQTYKNLELIVVDDASSDKTYCILSRLAMASPLPMKVFRNANNLGVGGALNRLVGLAHGEYIMLHADDDISYPHKIETLMRVLLSDESVVGVHSSIHEIDLVGNVIGERCHINQNREFSRKDVGYIIRNLTKLRLVTQSHILRKKVFEIFGAFHKKCSQEAIVLLFREAFVGRVVYIDEALTQYRIGSGTSTVAAKNEIGLLISESIKANKWYLYASKNICEDLEKVRDGLSIHNYAFLFVFSRWQHFNHWRRFQILNNKSLFYSLFGIVLWDRHSISSSLKVFFPKTFLVIRKARFWRSEQGDN